MQIRPSVPCFAKSVYPPIFLFKYETTTYNQKGNNNNTLLFSPHNYYKSKKQYVKVTAIVTSNFAQRVKRATCLMTITQYNSNNSLTPEFKCASFEKRNNLDELSTDQG